VATGDYFDIYGHFDTASSGNTQLTLQFGSTTGTLQTMIDTTSLAMTNNVLLSFHVRIVRTGASAGQAYVSIIAPGITPGTNTQNRFTLSLSGNWGSTTVFRWNFTGTGGGLSRIQYSYMQQ
jgi:hypothetical protein